LYLTNIESVKAGLYHTSCTDQAEGSRVCRLFVVVEPAESSLAAFGDIYTKTDYSPEYGFDSVRRVSPAGFELFDAEGEQGSLHYPTPPRGF
jgi:hypothetical protein